MISAPDASRPVREHRPAASRRLLLAAAVLALAGLLPATASAAPEAGVFLVEGQGGSTGELVVKQDAPVSFNALQASIAGGGSYGGVLIEPVEGLSGQRQRVGAIQVRAFNDGTRDAVGVLGVDGMLEPGRYRVTLFGEGPVSVRYPMNDSAAAGVRVVPATRVRMRLLGRAETLDLGYDTARVDLRRAAPAGQRVLQLRLSEPLEAGRAEMCASTTAACERPLLPVCLPSPAPCSLATTPGGPPPTATLDQPQVEALLHEAQPEIRSLLWSFEGYRDSPGKLRAAALLF